jgi:hypothetical protein
VENPRNKKSASKFARRRKLSKSLNSVKKGGKIRSILRSFCTFEKNLIMERINRGDYIALVGSLLGNGKAAR